jgi:hypothetical protein
MRLARATVHRIAKERGFTLTEALRRAGVSRNAFYHLARRDTVFPRSVDALAKALGVRTGALLDDPPATAEARTAALLSEARAIHARDRASSFENVWHTLWLLELPPAERLRRSLIRGGASTPHR